MEKLKPIEVKNIEHFFQLGQESLLKIMKRYLTSKYDTVYLSDQYVVAVGDIPVALVAHLDTVFSAPPQNIFYDKTKNVMWSPEGLGADDRAGVYAIVQLLKRGLRPTVIFTTDEEKGAIGATALTLDHPELPEPLKKLKYIIQLDRRGSNDCVFYDCENAEFEKYVEQFGFVTSFGTFSDISVICPSWEIAGVNLSIGYINEHSYAELLYVGNMLSTINKVEKMLKDASDDMESFKYIPSQYSLFSQNINEDYGWDPSWGISKKDWISWCQPSMSSCGFCHAQVDEYELYPVKSVTGIIHACNECLSNLDKVNWCKKCGEPFYHTEDSHSKLVCFDCVKESLDNDRD